MNQIDNIKTLKFEEIDDDPFWNTSAEREQKIHRIHAYPAKFPAFITTKALHFAKQKGVKVSRLADVFCGCGTVAYESRRNNIPFWGCDISPVATLIARAKSSIYNQQKLNRYFETIVKSVNLSGSSIFKKELNERLLYWYDKNRYYELIALKNAIENTIPAQSKYRSFFLCAFSNILKPTSRWLTKSIKPQIDPSKVPSNVMEAFKVQCKFMIFASSENSISTKTNTKIVTGNFLDETITPPTVDMIITSPPYVTSYEYADLHQLSTLWLGYTNDYRDFRKGSIGSLYYVFDLDKEQKSLNKTGTAIIDELLPIDKAKARSVAKYFLDMQLVANKCYSMLSDTGFALFVIGNTEYKSVRINNAKHLSESLKNSGFTKIFLTKRKIRQKILTPYRDTKGRFSTDKSSRKVYAEEFILIGEK